MRVGSRLDPGVMAGLSLQSVESVLSGLGDWIVITAPAEGWEKVHIADGTQLHPRILPVCDCSAGLLPTSVPLLSRPWTWPTRSASRDPNLTERGLILAAKLAAREVGPILMLEPGGIWDTDRISTENEWLDFGTFLRERVDRLG
jgi:hypothetical protein